jgi:hypothetical protein
MALGGFGLVGVGLYMMYPPLAFVVPGAALLTFGLWLAGVLPERRKGGG